MRAYWSEKRRFTHELVRRALYGQLPSVRRAELHLRHVPQSHDGVATLGFLQGHERTLVARRRASDFRLQAGGS